MDCMEYVDNIGKILSEDGKSPKLLRLCGVNTDSEKAVLCAEFDGEKFNNKNVMNALLYDNIFVSGISNFKIDDNLLYPIITECRVIKTHMELDIIRYVTKVSADAHMMIMKKMRPGLKARNHLFLVDR